MEKLSANEIRRYSRQLILDEIGVDGQMKLKQSSALIVGCGGLGCPAAMYLSAAGVGRIGLLDYDVVELSNLHRQILHREESIGLSKAQSIKNTLSQLNSEINYEVIDEKLSPKNAIEIVSKYDVVLDASDNAPTRYLINDACVVSGKPLVSGSALKFDGQLTVYNHGEKKTCYRCLYPFPPPAGTVTNCSDGGVIGVVPGIVGSMQALEAIKIILNVGSTHAGKMLLFDGLEGNLRQIRIRGQREDCAICSSNPTVIPSEFNYEEFCGTKSCDKTQQLKLLHELERVSVEDYKKILDSNFPHLLIDVRPAEHYKIVHLPNSISIPLAKLTETEGTNQFQQLIKELQEKQKNMNKQDQLTEVYVMCKLGNASQKAVHFLKNNLNLDKQVEIKDIEGGITAWAKRVDNSMPTY